MRQRTYLFEELPPHIQEEVLTGIEQNIVLKLPKVLKTIDNIIDNENTGKSIEEWLEFAEPNEYT